MTIYFQVNSFTPFALSMKTAMQCLLSRRSACLAVFMTAIAFGGAAHGAVISQYSFTGDTLNRSATTVAANVTAGNITDAPMVNGNPTVVLSRVTGVGYATQPVLGAARAAFNESLDPANVFFTFDVAANAGLGLDLSSLDFNVARGGGATPRTYDVRTSLDGFATSLTGGPVAILTQRPTVTAVSIDLSAAQFQGLSSPLTFQVRYFAPDFGQTVDFDDITLNGTVIPEPNTIALLAISGGGWVFVFQRRRREVV